MISLLVARHSSVSRLEKRATEDHRTSRRPPKRARVLRTSSRSSGWLRQCGPPRAREISLLASSRQVLRGAVEGDLLAAEKDILGGDDPPAASAELVGGGDVAVIERDHPRRQREGVGAVGPLFALLGHRVGAAAGDELEIEPALTDRVEDAARGGSGVRSLPLRSTS